MTSYTKGWLTYAGAILLGTALIFSAGCASTIRELSNDGAVVGFTGVFFAVGVDVAGGIPLPAVRLGYGTAWRVGNHDNMAVTVDAENTSTGVKTGLAIGATNNPR